MAKVVGLLMANIQKNVSFIRFYLDFCLCDVGKRRSQATVNTGGRGMGNRG
jgi:hypothetical protein